MIDDFKRPPQRRPVRIDTIGGAVLNSGQSQSPASPGENIIYPTNGSGAAPPDKAAPAIAQPDNYTDSSSISDRVAAGNNPLELPESTERRGRLALFKRWRRPTKKQAIIIAAVIVLLIGAGAAYALNRSEPAPEPAVKAAKPPAPKPAPKPILSPLTGIPVSAEQQVRPVTAVMLENSANARPQSGLRDAGVVFEAIAEYGVTRFMALYQETNPATIGPIRSLRPYFIDWAMPFDAAIAHVGGSPDALQKVRDLGSRDLDQFHNAGAYHRINSRYAPHNMYSSMDALVNAGKAKGYATSTFTGFERTAKEQPGKTPNAKTIDLAISGAFYNVHYDYNPEANTYKRTMGGTPHIDMESKAQIEPKVVIALSMPYSLMPNGYHSQYQTTGSGLAHFFQNGMVTTGSWHKTDIKSQFVFKDDAGAPVKLNPGQTWITIVGDSAKVTFAP